MTRRLVPRVVLVTGGNRGLGLSCANAFAEQGDRVAVTYRTDIPSEVRKAGFLAVQCDVTDTEQVEASFDEIEETIGPIEVLVANAGIHRDVRTHKMSDDTFTDVLETNLTGAFRVARRATRNMMSSRWGRIVFISSIVGRIGATGAANYAASKSGLVGLSRSLAQELGRWNITVNVVAPGPLRTGMGAALSDEIREAYREAIPLGRLGDPDEVSEVVRFLASEHASYMTGAVIPVDGGLSMG